MSGKLAFKPGIVYGLYPEKTMPKINFLDQFLSRTVYYFKRLINYNQRSLLGVIRFVQNYEAEFKNADNEELSRYISAIKSKLSVHGLKNEIIYEAFALIREISDRKIGLRHFDVQLIGGWVMIKGMVAEMNTGEGKTLVATLPACTVAMVGIPVHIVTVNDYLVTRDAELMRPVYQAFGLSVGVITEGMGLAERQAAYACDITYCSNKQLAFDYLKDKLVLGRYGRNIQLHLEKLYKSQSTMSSKLHMRGLCYAIVDEADSVLIDESRTPLILSRDNNSLGELNVYHQALYIAQQLKELEDFVIDKRNRIIELTFIGTKNIAEITTSFKGIWSGKKRSGELIIQALTAQHLFIRDVNYIVKEDKVLIVDEFTGRVMADRSWEKGLHQLIEIKEGCKVSGEKETISRISYQTFFRRYLYLSGMTGTAREVSGELFSVYKLSVVKIPTHKPVISKHLKNCYFARQEDKWSAVLQRIKVIHASGQPVLVGTRSVEASEYFSRLLKNIGLDYHLLNARQDENEAEIIKNAGVEGSITIATNMAGRGTDIALSPGINKIGGLHIIATECHESRRIDQQLFGRCGRQGDAGSYEMYLSLEDEIVVKYTPSAIIFICKKTLKSHIPGSIWFTRMVFYLAQTRAQIHHASIREILFKMDNKMDDFLAFSGKSE